MLDTMTRQRFETALQAGDLKALVAELRSEGQSQVAIYELFSSFWKIVREEDREADEHIVGDALDFMSGWCSHNLMWFDPPVTMKELREYLRAKGKQA